MKPEALPNIATVVSDGHDVRRRSAVAISSVERSADAGRKVALAQFFSAAALATDVSGGLQPGTTVVANSAAVPILGSTGTPTGTSGTAAVTGNTLSGVQVPATAGLLVTGATIQVGNSAGGAMRTCSLTVAANVASGRLPSTVAIVDNGTAYTVPVTGTYATKATTTVVNGVITGIVLS